VALSRREILQGGLLMAAGGLGMAAAPRAVVPIWAGGMEALVPAHFGAWQSSSDDAAIVLPSGYDRMLSHNYDAQLARVYRRADGVEILCVIAASAAQTGGLLVHRPESCYPAAGFTILGNRLLEHPLGENRLRRMRARFLTAQCAARIEQILYWIRIGDEFPTSSWGEQWAAVRGALKGGLGGSALPDGVLVRLSVVSADAAQALPELEAFAAQMYQAAGAAGRRLLAGEI
jgi:EpsI family protein